MGPLIQTYRLLFGTKPSPRSVGHYWLERLPADLPYLAPATIRVDGHGTMFSGELAYSWISWLYADRGAANEACIHAWDSHLIDTLLIEITPSRDIENLNSDCRIYAKTHIYLIAEDRFCLPFSREVLQEYEHCGELTWPAYDRYMNALANKSGNARVSGLRIHKITGGISQ